MKAAVIAKRAYKEHRPVLEVACEESNLNPVELARLLDPTALTEVGFMSSGRWWIRYVAGGFVSSHWQMRMLHQ